MKQPQRRTRPPRAHSSVAKLPAEVLAAIEARLHAGDTYHDITEHLNRLGHDVSRASVARWGKKVCDRQAHLSAAADLARMLSDQLGADELEQTATLLALELVVDALMQHDEITADELYLPHVTQLISALARVSTANLARDKFKTDLERKAREAADAVAGMGREGGWSEETVERVKARIMGIPEGIA